MRILLCLPFLFFASFAWGADLIIGGETNYVVQKGDRLEIIGARLGVFWKNIAKENGLDPDVKVTPGQQIKVTNRKIVPRVIDDGIIINIADRTLYHFKSGRLNAFPVGLGLPLETDFGDWRTPTGKFTIIGKKTNPIWYVPESIQMEMAFRGKTVEEAVPPGPKNPLGKHALITSIPGVLIHETILPASVYRYQSHGCIRMLPEAMEKLFPEVEKGTKGELIYEPVKVAMAGDGRAYLEVRTDTYRKVASMRDHVWKRIEEKGLSGKVDRDRVEQIIKEKTGVACDISVQARAIEQETPKKAFHQRLFDLFTPGSKKTNSSKTYGPGAPGIRVQNPASRVSLSTSSL